MGGRTFSPGFTENKNLKRATLLRNGLDKHSILLITYLMLKNYFPLYS